MSSFQIFSKEYYSNCFIEAVKAKLKAWKKITITPLYHLLIMKCSVPHFLWSDGEYDYDFGYEHKLPLIFAWTLHKGHIRRRALGFNQRYKDTCKEWAKRHRGDNK